MRKLLAENKKQEAQMIILTEVQSQFGGAAKAAADPQAKVKAATTAAATQKAAVTKAVNSLAAAKSASG